MLKTLKLFMAAMAAMALCLMFSGTAYADTLEGQLNITYSDSSGMLNAIYSGDCSLTNPEYKWFRDGTEVSTSKEYKPDDTGSYYCELRDDGYYDNKLTSAQKIVLHEVDGKNILVKNNYGLYEQGKTVTVTADVRDNEKVTGWRINIDGVRMPESGTSVSFKMPAQDVFVTAEIKAFYTIKVVGGTADKYQAAQGDVITLTASDVDNKKFVSWVTTGGAISNANNKVCSVTMPNKNIQVTANFAEDKEAAAKKKEEEAKKQEEDRKKAEEAAKPKFTDPTRILYELPWSNNYKVTAKHSKQGPACDLAFKLAAGTDFLCLDYFNIIINDNPDIRETPTPITICITLPADLQWGGRNWRALCVSRGGFVYSFPDEDEDDTTITFSPDRFYAFALCYNDEPEPEVEELIEDIVEEEPVEEEITIEYDPALAPTSEEIQESHSYGPSASHSVTESQTADPSEIQRTAPSSYSTPLNVESDKQSAIRTANGAKVATLPM